MYEDFFVPYPVIETDRLIIRMVRKSDAGELFELCRRPETSKYSAWSPHRDLSETRKYISFRLMQYRKRCCTFFVAEERATSRLIGSCSYASFDEAYKVTEIGYSVLSDLWNRGLATEIAGALTGYAFDRIGVQRVFARVLPENAASARVLMKLGFAFEGTHKKEFCYDGKVSDVDIYAITDDMYFKRGNNNGV